VLSDPAPDVLVMDLAGSSVNVRARWWIAPPQKADALDARDRVLTALKGGLTSAGIDWPFPTQQIIDLPFPTQQILFHHQTETTDGDRARQREGWPAGSGVVPGPRRVTDHHRIAERTPSERTAHK
jgi:small-conductance mechanosensitive channel